MVKAGCERAAGKLDKVFAVGCGGVWVYSGMGVGLMLSEVREDVNQGVANLAWAGQRTAVPAVCEEPAATTEQLVHVASDSNTEPAQPFHQSGAIVCFDQQVNVVGLNRKVDNANFAAGLRLALAMARRTVGNTNCVRRERQKLRRVTCTGCSPRCAGRLR